MNTLLVIAIAIVLVVILGGWYWSIRHYVKSGQWEMDRRMRSTTKAPREFLPTPTKSEAGKK